jgi:hypothetical protein
MTPTTYTINGTTYEPLTDYMRGWLPGALGLPCPPDPSPAIRDAWNSGAKQFILRGTHGLSNVLWHECKCHTCRKVEPCA